MNERVEILDSDPLTRIRYTNLPFRKKAFFVFDQAPTLNAAIARLITNREIREEDNSELALIGTTILRARRK